MPQMIEPNPSVTDLLEQASTLIRERFGAEPAWTSVAPGRINLIGEHTDYNQGWVLPIAINRYTLLSAAPGPVSGSINVFSAALGEQATLVFQDEASRDAQPHPVGWVRYLEGVISEYRSHGVVCPALDMVAVSSVPLGGGLSSSAALEIATAHLIEAATTQIKTSELRIAASICAERDYAGVPCGMMDQTVSERGRAEHALLLDCRDETVAFVPCLGSDVVVLVVHSGVSHALASSAYAERRAECELAAATLGCGSLRFAEIDKLSALQGHPVLLKRARHVITENRRVHEMAEALTTHNAERAGVLLTESHESLRDDFAVSCEPVDHLVALAQAEAGVLGARMTGGGFGGCVIALVRREEVDAVAQSICRGYSQYTGKPTRCFTAEAVSGAREMNLAL